MMPFLLKLIDKNDPSHSLKHLAYGVVVAFACLWLSWNLFVVEKMASEWVAAFGLLLTAVTTGKVVGSAPSPAPTTGAITETVVEK